MGYSRDGLCIDDVNIVKYVCGVITTRGAALAALALATLINRIDRDKIVIAASGSTIEKHPKLAKLMIDFTRELSDGHKEVELKIETNGAGKGGALIAAVADKFFKQIESRRNELKIASKPEGDDKLTCTKLVTNSLANTCIQAN